MRILITGGSSYLGQHLVPLAIQQGHHVIWSYFNNQPNQLGTSIHLDLSDPIALNDQIKKWQPEAIIHLAGSNRPPERMQQTIEQGAEHITRAAAAIGARLIHFSTDVLFDGQNAPYTEKATPSPLHLYGRAKTTSEQIIATYTNSVIIRTSLIYSLSHMDRSSEWMSHALQNGETISLFTNQIRQPVWALTLAHACLELLTHSYCGILNIAGNQSCTRAYFAYRMLDYWQIGHREQIKEINYSGHAHPLDCRLDISLAQSILATPLIGLDELLASYHP